MNGLKKAAFLHGLSFPMLSIHQDFVDPDPAKRQKADKSTDRPATVIHDFEVPELTWKPLAS